MNIIKRMILTKGERQALEQKSFNGRFEISGGRLVMPPDNKQTYITDGYNSNDIVYSIINIILDKCRLPYWNLNKIVDESKLRRYHQLMSLKDMTSAQYKQSQVLKKEALAPITNFNLQMGKLNELLKYPNETETFQDFITSGSQYKLVTGDCYMWGDVLGKGANAGIPNSIMNLPSQHMTIKIDGGFPARVAQYVLLMWNQEFAPETILHEIYANPNWNMNGEQLYGFSPLKAFLKNIVRNNAAKDASIAKFRNGGTEELIYVDDNRWTPAEGMKQAEFIKAKLMSNEFRGPDAQGKIAISGIPMGSVKLGLSPVDLGITESEKWDAVMLCNGYGLPPELLGLTNKTFNNIKEAEKALTTRSALPVLDSRKNALNRKLQTDWGFKGQNVYLDYSTECFPELQADQKDISDWYSSIIMVIPDQQREALGQEALNTTESKEVWVKTASGYQPLSDFQAGLVDQTLNDGVNNAAVAAGGKTGV